jgi:hypothetical protein
MVGWQEPKVFNHAKRSILEYEKEIMQIVFWLTPNNGGP